METSKMVDELQAEMDALKKQITQFMKIHSNPHDTCKHDEMAKKLALIEKVLKGEKVDLPTTGTTDQPNTGTTDQPDTGTTDQPSTGTPDQPSTDGTDGNLSTMKGAVEQARSGAKEALATVKDLNAKQITIADAEKAKIKAYIAKADEFLKAYEGADDAQKKAFDSANSGYVAEIKQSRDWNANSFLPKTEGGSSDGSNSNEQPSTPPNSNQGSDQLPPNPSIGSAVGSGAKNHPPNVKIVQMLLNKKGAKLEVDGKIGNQTIGAIERFQANVFDGDFSGVIQPNDKTWKKLVGTGGSAAGSGRPTPKPGSTDDNVEAASFTFEREARRDRNGRLQVYKPPSGDGGGAYEIAGITQRYQPKVAARLKRLIETGQHAQAEKEAKEFFAKRGAPFTKHTNSKGLKMQLSDTVHHRGEGGLRRVLQRATGMSTKDYGELIRTLSAKSNALELFHQARQAYEWEEIDRGRASRRKFRKGLQSRFDQAYKKSKQLGHSM